LLTAAFWALDRARFRVCLHGLERFTNQPGTLVVSNHKSDSDVLLLGPALRRAFRERGPVGRMAFVAAEQMFQPGYVSAYLLPGPRWLQRLVHPANLSAALQALRAYPVPRSGRRLLAAYLHEILEEEGDLPLRRVFRGDPRRIVPDLDPDATISEALQWPHQRAVWRYCRLSVFRPEVARRLRRRHVEEIHACLDCFASILDHGDSVFIAPEGSLSDDGRFGGIRAGLGRLVQRTGRSLTLLPTNVTYDPMGSGRPRAFLSIGRELRAGVDWSADRVDRIVDRAIRELTTITLPQLIAPHLLGRSGEADGITEDEGRFKRRLYERARALAERGLLVDRRLLDAEAFDRRWRELLRYARRQNLLESHEGRIRCPDAGGSPSGNGTPSRSAGRAASVWAYYANELESVPAVPEIQSRSAAEEPSRCRSSNPASSRVARTSGNR
jgi:1-acyl-sn-glycerol-3-phosphate acyltransferase